MLDRLTLDFHRKPSTDLAQGQLTRGRFHFAENCIEFGAPPETFVLTKKTPVRLVKPKEGLLVLFPSYFYHRTIPFEGDEERVSIAFDFVPEFARLESD